MVYAIKGLDVLTFAIEVEKNGKKFYEAVAARVQEQKAKELFLNLAKEEEKHIGDFEKLLEKVSGQESAETYEGEYLDYVKALVDNHVFRRDIDVARLADNVTGVEDALDLALRFEKDSILFFVELKEVIFAKEKGIIEELIEQEHSHILTLSKWKKQLI